MLQKYQESLLQSIHRQIESWLESETAIASEDLHRFLHSVKGTAGTIAMNELSETAGRLWDEAAAGKGHWKAEELRSFLYPLMKIAYEFNYGMEPFSDAFFLKEKDIPLEQPLILVLDDDVTLLRYLKDELERRHYFVVATVSPDQAIRYFHDLAPDCFILDLLIPEKNGFEVMETLQGCFRLKFVPTTVISIDRAKETRLKAFRFGADDFLEKPIDMDDLLARLERQLRRKRHLDRLLFVDELTGAYNRKYLSDAYRRVCLEKSRSSSNFSLAVIDLDHFKKVNDRFGHLVGDRVLAGFSEFVRSNIRSFDSLIRFGGEEFVLLLPHTAESEAVKLVDRLRDGFAKLDFGLRKELAGMTFSAGVAEIADADPELFDRWLEAADFALYQAKERGRNRTEVWSADAFASWDNRKLNIAVVDDDAIIRSLLIEFLKESLGKEVQIDAKEFRDGNAFLEDPRHADKLPYLVVLDGMMPGMDGLEVLKRIRSRPESDQYSVIMLTGRSGEEDVARALRLGADDYLTKPFRMKELETRIRRLIDRIR